MVYVIAVTLLSLLLFSSDPADSKKTVLPAPKANKSCLKGSTAPPRSLWRWRIGTSIAIYFFQDAFTKPEKEALNAGIKVWDDAAQEVNSGIRFTYAGESPSVANCPGCVTVLKKNTWSSSRRIGEFIPLGFDGSGFLQMARIEIDNGVKDLHTLNSLIVHELGHGMGLWDCPSCTKKSTIMGTFKGRNESNGLEQPTPCDLAVVNTVFASQYINSSNVLEE